MSGTRLPSQEKLARWHWVAEVPYLGPVRFHRLLKKLGNGIDEIFRMSDRELAQLKGIVPPQVRAGIKAQRDRREYSESFAMEQLERARGCGGRIVLLGSSEYPEFLARSTVCHPLLFCIGNIEKFRKYEKSIAIVGTRRPTDDSGRLARDTARALAKQGWVIVSGMAKGIDAEAHEGALETGGSTIAVLGNGPDVVYPPECKEIYRRITEHGLVLSEYPFGVRPSALNLKKRNKTTVALSLGVFVVETSATGGAMNAVKAAEEQRKPVIGVTGRGARFSGNRLILKKRGHEFTDVRSVSRVCLDGDGRLPFESVGSVPTRSAKRPSPSLIAAPLPSDKPTNPPRS